jgi:vancomycin permeability regulator SanA
MVIQLIRRWFTAVWRRRVLRWTLIVVGVGVVVAFAGLVSMNLWVTRSAERYRYAEVEEVPHRPVAVVLGAGVVGTDPTPTLASRLDGAIELYRTGKVEHLLMSGDNSRPEYDEVTAMRDYAIGRGVPGGAITRDYAGFDTYDTCVRAREIFGVTGAVMVTQDFHIARAIWTCRELGIDAVGLAIPDWGFRESDLDYRYTRGQEVGYTIREWFARAKSVLETEVLHPDPKLGGPYEGLTET